MSLLSCEPDIIEEMIYFWWIFSLTWSFRTYWYVEQVFTNKNGDGQYRNDETKHHGSTSGRQCTQCNRTVHLMEDLSDSNVTNKIVYLFSVSFQRIVIFAVQKYGLLVRFFPPKPCLVVHIAFQKSHPNTSGELDEDT